MSMDDIAEKMHHLPTMMSLAEEKNIIAELMKLKIDAIVNNWDLFASVMSNLLVSRSASFYEILEGDRPFFMAFSQYLNALSQRVESPKKDELLDYSRIFALFP